MHRAKPNLYACSIKSIPSYLQAFPNVFYHKGLFPHSVTNVPGDERFSFAEFLDDKPGELIELPTTQCMVVKR